MKSSLSSTTCAIQPLPPRSSVLAFDKLVLALLVNDIFVCNILLPLHLIDILKDLPCEFLCLLLKISERSTSTIELIIIHLLLMRSLIFFWRKRLLTMKLCLISLIFMLPILITCFLTALRYSDEEKNELNYRQSTCKQTNDYINLTTQKILNIFFLLF